MNKHKDEEFNNKQERLKIAILEDGPYALHGIKLVLEAERDLQVVGAVGDPEQMLKIVETKHPDIAIVDLKISGQFVGATIVAEIKMRFPRVECIVLTSFPELEHFLAAYHAGAKAFVFKDGDPELRPSLPALVRIVASGGQYHDPELMDQILSYLNPSRPPLDVLSMEADTINLTERELQILSLLAKKQSNSEIAKNLVISVNTVKQHVSRILGKLHAKDRHEAVLVAMSKNLLYYEAHKE